VPSDAAPAASSSSQEAPPPKPPRPLSPQAQAQATLQEAFPSIDAAVVRAVLVASGGQVEPAFTALLSEWMDL
jgi:CUE domain